jgi:hypothetical protein
MSTRCTRLPFCATIPGIAALYACTRASRFGSDSGVMVATKTSASGAVDLILSMRPESRAGALARL